MKHEEIIAKSKQKLLDKLESKNFLESDIEQITKAIEYAIVSHDKQLRKSGEPYVIHPIETACILVDWDLDVVSIISGLLHDLIEDTNVTEEDIKNEFGDSVAYIVTNLSKVSSTIAQKRKETNENPNSEQKDNTDYFIKMFFSMAKDVRVAAVKLADRLHNMSTIEFLPIHKQQRIAKETINLYANLAGRVGMYFVKTELLDMSFKILSPKEYDLTKNKIDSFIKRHESSFKKNKEKIESLLNYYGIKYEIFDRVKGIYSTSEKIRKNNFTIDSIHDLYAIRIVTDELFDCYKILGIIHTNFSIVKKTFNDFIANPKRNLYQSIHTTIMINGAHFEVQIRTQKMDELSRNGVAAHWMYKENTNVDWSSELVTKFTNYTEAIQKNEFERKILINNQEIFDIYVWDDEIYHSIIVSENIKAIDVAFRFNQEKFPYIQNIFVNGEDAPFDQAIKKNDTINLKYADNILINKSWLQFSSEETTKKFIIDEVNKTDELDKDKIKKFFDKINDELKNKWVGEKRTEEIIKGFGYENIIDFINDVSASYFQESTFFKLFSINNFEKQKARKKLSLFFSRRILQNNYIKSDGPIEIKDVEFTSCCNKCLGIDIVGFIISDKLNIHNVNCDNVQKLIKKNKVIPFTWDEEEILKRKKKFLCTFKFKYLWNENTGNEITYWINKIGMKLNNFSITKPNPQGICEMNVSVFVGKSNQIDKFILKLRSTNNLKEIIKR